MSLMSVAKNNHHHTQQHQDAASAVLILACGRLDCGSWVWAIMIVQPVQSWTVIRSDDEFQTLAAAVGLDVPEVQSCDVRSTAAALQSWLARALVIGSTNSTTTGNPNCASLARPLQEFLTTNANVMPPQYEGVEWTQFLQQPAAAAPATNNHNSSSSSLSHTPTTTAVADMDMEDMFLAEDDEDDEQDLPVTNGLLDDDDVPAPAHERYRPTNEAVTDEDEMDLAGEVEMIDDIGSLAQSLGASHLGRSLPLQQQLQQPSHQPRPPQQEGLTLGGRPQSSNVEGGIGSIMEKQQQQGFLSSARPTSQPRLDCFKMLKVIGKGSFGKHSLSSIYHLLTRLVLVTIPGKVFLVRENRTSDIYALKVLRKENIIKRNQVEHTNTERSVLGYVKHRFIVGMNMAFQSRDKLYFVLDYCPGGELFFHLGKEGRFPEARARFYAAEISLAISYIHSLDIIYRDLKPENVLLDANGHIRLTDFGLSKEGISNSSSGANSFCGTPEYLAPEILNRQGHGRAVDWWSLGAVLYEMLTGLPPFYSQDRDRLFEKIKRSELNYPASVSRVARPLLVGLLAKDPQRRLGSGAKDAADIQSKDFFATINFDTLLRDAQNGVPAPWKPHLTGLMDTSQFDKEFTRMPVFSPQSLPRHFGTTPDGGLFANFTFTDRHLHSTEAGV